MKVFGKKLLVLGLAVFMTLGSVSGVNAQEPEEEPAMIEQESESAVDFEEEEYLPEETEFYGEQYPEEETEEAPGFEEDAPETIPEEVITEEETEETVTEEAALPEEEILSETENLPEEILTEEIPTEEEPVPEAEPQQEPSEENPKEQESPETPEIPEEEITTSPAASEEDLDVQETPETVSEEIPEEESESEEENPEEETEPEEYSDELLSGSGITPSAGDSEELLSEYLDLEIANTEGLDLFGNYNAGKLKGAQRTIYDKLKSMCKSIIKGERTSTELTLKLSGSGLTRFKWSTKKSDVDAIDSIVSKAVEALYFDCPYEMYWYAWRNTWTSPDRTKKTRNGKFWYTSLEVTVKLEVAPDYRGSQYSVNRSKVLAVDSAVRNIKNIVSEGKGKSDYEKLRFYKNKICSMNVYNTAAANSTVSVGENNPWQIIYLFDGNDSTNVLCTGYAKGFQYLCEKTSFSGSVKVYRADGEVSQGGGTPGGHTWNIVKYNGTNYLVDVTFLDTGASESYAFMVRPASGNIKYGYTFYKSNTDQNTYIYWDNTKLVYSKSDLSFVLDTSRVPDGFNLIGSKWKYYENNHLKNSTGLIYDKLKGSYGWYPIRGGIFTGASGITRKIGSYDTAWYFVKKGKIDYSYTGLAKKLSGGKERYYVVNGVKSDKTGFVKGEKSWCYVHDGKFASGRTGLVKGTINGKTNTYFIRKGRYVKKTGFAARAYGNSKTKYYVKNGVIYRKTGFVKGANGWCYIRKGKLSPRTGLVKGKINKQSGWYFIRKGRLNKKTGFVKKAYGNDSNYYYVRKGKRLNKTALVNGKTGLCYIRNGQFTKVTGLVQVQRGGKKGWYYVADGRFTKKTGLAQRAYGGSDNKYYIVKGKLVKKTGLVKIGNNRYYIVNGLFTRKTGFVKGEASTCYLKNGRLYKKTGLVYGKINGKKNWYFIRKGRYQKATCIARRAGSGSKTKYYVKDGKWSKYTGTVKINGKKYKVKNGVIQ